MPSGASGPPHLVSLKGPVPATRATDDELQAEVRAAMANPIVRALLETLDGGLLILDAHRQIVAANLRHLVAEPERSVPEVLGLRAGEALGCVHADERPGGCGSSDACRTCGALLTVLSCQRTREAQEGECLVTVGGDGLGALELRLRATPIEIDGKPFTALTFRDVSAEKRRAVLEQLFFHDLLNSVAGLASWSQLLVRAPEERLRPTAERVAGMVRRLEAEVRGERALHLAERGELVAEPQVLSPDELLEALAADLAAHPLARGRTVRVEEAARVEVHADRSLLLRVLANMVTNALEATPEGGTVEVGARVGPGSCTFFVRNAGAIPPEVQPRVFQRSFSTKSRQGRGLGTYGMKLLGERYLGGRVDFTSTEATGTEFRLRLPLA